MRPPAGAALFGRPGGLVVASALLTTALVAAALLTACDPGADVTVLNGTNHVVSFYREKDLEATLPPGDHRTFTYITYQGTQTFTASDEQGRIIFREQYTWDDLKRLNWKILIQ